MTNVINLNRARKARARAADEKQAAENRVKFGRTKAEKQMTKLEAERATRLHSGLKREAGNAAANDGTPAKDLP